MRCDANIPLMPIGAKELGTRTETKNINSLKSVEVAVRYEMRRQAAVLDAGGEVIQETRHFQEADGTTAAGRRKETAEDYRYFPEPDLEPVAPSAEWVEELRGTLPELPWIRRARIQKDWGISDEVMRDLVNAGAIDLVIATTEAGASPEAARGLPGGCPTCRSRPTPAASNSALCRSPRRRLRRSSLSSTAASSTTRSLARSSITSSTARVTRSRLSRPTRSWSSNVTKPNSPPSRRRSTTRANPDIADKIRSGKVQAAGKIVGDVMKATRGQADAARVKELVIEACS